MTLRLGSCFDPGMTTDDTPRLPGLSPSDTRWLVAEAQKVLSELGRSSSVLDGVALEVEGGTTMGLDNLARTVAMMPRRRWARAVRDQLTVLDRARPDHAPAGDDLRVKLWPQQRGDGFLDYEALQPLPGILAVIAAQGDGFSHEYGRLDLVGDRDKAYDTALANLAALPRPRHTRRRVDPDIPGAWVEFLESRDAYGAARVTVLPDLLRKLRIDFPSHGVLVAVPTKFELWVHVPVDRSVVDTAVAMSWLAFRTFTEEPYPISPDVFHLSPDMHAVRVVAPDAKGFELDDRALLGLLRAMGAELGETG